MMKLSAINHFILCLVNIGYVVYHKVEAISREIEYPLGKLFGKSIFHPVTPPIELLTKPEISEFELIPSRVPLTTVKAKTLKKKKKKHFKRKHKHKAVEKKKEEDAMNEEEEQITTKRPKKRKSRRKKKKVIKRVHKKKAVKQESDDNAELTSPERNYEENNNIENVLKFKDGRQIEVSKPRKPVDIVVHIKMEE